MKMIHRTQFRRYARTPAEMEQSVYKLYVFNDIKTFKMTDRASHRRNNVRCVEGVNECIQVLVYKRTRFYNCTACKESKCKGHCSVILSLWMSEDL